VRKEETGKRKRKRKRTVDKIVLLLCERGHSSRKERVSFGPRTMSSLVPTSALKRELGELEGIGERRRRRCSKNSEICFLTGVSSPPAPVPLLPLVPVGGAPHEASSGPFAGLRKGEEEEKGRREIDGVGGGVRRREGERKRRERSEKEEEDNGSERVGEGNSGNRKPAFSSPGPPLPVLALPRSLPPTLPESRRRLRATPSMTRDARHARRPPPSPELARPSVPPEPSRVGVAARRGVGGAVGGKRSGRERGSGGCRGR